MDIGFQFHIRGSMKVLNQSPDVESLQQVGCFIVLVEDPCPLRLTRAVAHMGDGCFDCPFGTYVEQGRRSRIENYVLQLSRAVVTFEPRCCCLLS